MSNIISDGNAKPGSDNKVKMPMWFVAANFTNEEYIEQELKILTKG